MGDPSGVGPEVCWKGITQQLLSQARISLIGIDSVLSESQSRFSSHLGKEAKNIDLISLSDSYQAPLEKGTPSVISGQSALEAIRLATDLCLNNDADALVTAPVSKKAIEMAGTPFTGHTEWISSRCGTYDEMMMMSDLSQKLHVGYLTTHIPLKKVSKILSPDLVERRLRQCLEFRSQLGDLRPIAICGLNPHAGENGLIGSEEDVIICPVVKKLQKESHPIEGPFPADTLFVESQRKRFSIILSLFHDQGGIPFKMLAFDKGVNHTLGLPIVRTSVDHGTAWDIAWQGKASGTSMTAAIEMAILRSKAGWKEQSSIHNDAPNP
jgi:4-hydroxythreonine-4-phosphate dehydrogenase